ncbi:hypothetical protein D3C76_1704420 [compost metagenome]
MSKLDAGNGTGSIARRPLSTASEAPSISIEWIMKASRCWTRSTTPSIPLARLARRVSSESQIPATIAARKAGMPMRTKRRISGRSIIRFSR